MDEDLNSTQSIQDTLDNSRLESLNLSREDIEKIKILWQPITSPPSADFNRTIDLKVTYGWVRPDIAKAALLKPNPFPNDAQKAAQFRNFLLSQTGESKDHYTVFFAELTQWNETNNLFVKCAKESIANMKKKDLNLRDDVYDSNGRGMKLEKRNSSSVSKSSKDKLGESTINEFKFGDRLRSSFSGNN